MTARKKTSPIIIPRATWPEAEIVADPVRENELVEPRVCVRRRIPDLCGPNGEAMFVVHGAGQHISLFTGCGGMDLGVEEAGFVTVVQHEWDKFACDTLILNRPNFFRYSALIQGDIRKTPTSTILREAGLRCGEATLLTGGTPCQGFSTAGKRDAKDIRNTLVFDFLRVVRESQPRFFVMENVPGFVSMKKHDFLRSFLEIAHDAYYELVYGLVDAAQYGVPQNRTRFICMGTRRDLVEIDGHLASLPAATHFDPKDLAEARWLGKRPLFGGDLRLLTHPPGIRYFADRELLIPPHPTSKYDGRANGPRVSKAHQSFFDRLRREEPDRIVCAPVQGADVDQFDRHVTVRDAIYDLAEPVAQ